MYGYVIRIDNERCYLYSYQINHMPDKNQFISELDSSYQFSGVAITLGAGMLDGEVQTNHLVKIPVKMMNRHGLIAGATGTEEKIVTSCNAV